MYEQIASADVLTSVGTRSSSDMLIHYVMNNHIFVNFSTDIDFFNFFWADDISKWPQRSQMISAAQEG